MMPKATKLGADGVVSPRNVSSEMTTRRGRVHAPKVKDRIANFTDNLPLNLLQIRNSQFAIRNLPLRSDQRVTGVCGEALRFRNSEFPANDVRSSNQRHHF